MGQVFGDLLGGVGVGGGLGGVGHVGQAGGVAEDRQELLGQAGGPVRPPFLQLTEEEKQATRKAFETCGLKL